MLQESLRTIYAEELVKDPDYDAQAFWTRYKDTAKLFLNERAMEKVLGETECWQNVAPELSCLATESKLGQDLFLAFCPSVVKAHINQHMKDTMLGEVQKEHRENVNCCLSMVLLVWLKGGLPEWCWAEGGDGDV